MFTLEYNNKELTLTEDSLKIEHGGIGSPCAYFTLDADECRALAAALLNAAESQVLRQAINNWVGKTDSLLRHLPVDVLMQIYRGELVDTNIDTSRFIKEINAMIKK
jgi:hypothetical protein